MERLEVQKTKFFRLPLARLSIGGSDQTLQDKAEKVSARTPPQAYCKGANPHTMCVCFLFSMVPCSRTRPREDGLCWLLTTLPTA